MRNLLIFFTFLLSSCGNNEPDAIKDRVYLDTIEQGDTTVVRPDVVLPGDRTDVADTVEPKVGPVH